MTNNLPIRLHKLVSQTLKKNANFDYTQPEIQKNIEKYGVFVDGQLSFKRLEWVFVNQDINITHWPKRETGNLQGIRVLEETSDYLLIYKPINLTVQPGIGHQSDNLVNWLIERYPEQKSLLYQSSFDWGDNLHCLPASKILNPTAGLVHRIDKNAQGLLLVARNLETLNFFQNQFRSRTAIKKYLTVVAGLLTQRIDITNWQTRDANDPIRQKLFWTEQQAQEYDKNARQAESVFLPKVLCPELNQTLVEVEIKTGRMHQIRLQAENLGYALGGDLVYNRVLSQPKKFIANEQNPHNLPVVAFQTKLLTQFDSLKFQQLKQQIFGQTDFCLLSNFLQINTPHGVLVRNFVDLEAEISKFDKITC